MRQLQPSWHMLAISLHHKISISKGSQSELPWYDAQSRSISNGWRTYKRANRPALVLNCTVEPGISDHQIVVAENKLIAQRRKPLNRKIILWKRADYAELRKEVKSLENSISEKFDRTTPINIVWNIFLKEIKEIQDRCVPSKTASVSFHQPWITTDIKRLSRSKRKAYRKAKLTSKPWERYNDIEKNTRQLAKHTYTMILRKLTQILSWCASATVKDFSGMLCETD